MLKKFPVIIGPTAGGKSALAIDLADQLRARGEHAEFISADAFQIYRGMDIGTAKPTPDERARYPHHGIDLVEPAETFTVAQWVRSAEDTIGDIRRRGGAPIVVGGTHLYIKSLLEGLFDGPEPDPALRAALAELDPAARRAELERVDPAAAARIHPADDRRTIRALEVYRATGRPISDWQQQWDRATSRRTDAVLIVLDWPTEAINRRINARVREMIDRGLVEEARALHQSGALPPDSQAAQALGYKQLIAHFQGRHALDEAIEKIKIETRRFAKNQRTWLRRLAPPAAPGVIRLSMTDPDESPRLALDALAAK